MIFRKIRWVLGVLMVFFLVLATNLIDRRNFQTIQNSIDIIYEKQLISKNILLEISTLVHEKAMANALEDTTFYNGRNQEVDEEIDILFEEFEETDLAYKEQRTVRLCKEKLEQTAVLEQERMKDPAAFANGERGKELAWELERISEDLSNLSVIQLEEGRRQMKIGENAMSSIDMFTKLEIIFLIVMAVLVQVLILYSPKNKGEKEPGEI